MILSGQSFLWFAEVLSTPLAFLPNFFSLFSLFSLFSFSSFLFMQTLSFFIFLFFIVNKDVLSMSFYVIASFFILSILSSKYLISFFKILKIEVNGSALALFLSFLSSFKGFN